MSPSVAIVGPRQRGVTTGNRVTALRWASCLRRLGARVRWTAAWDGRPCQLLVALHAVRSAPSIERYRERHPQGPLVVAATGTDIYGPPADREVADASLSAADRVVVLQRAALAALPPAVRPRARVILQSVRPALDRPLPAPGFQACVLANLRAVKDPLLAAHAVALLPASSRVHVALLGEGTDAALGGQARALAARSLRFSWLGPYPHRGARRFLLACQALISSSHSEGGANAVGEAIVSGVPPLVTSIAGTLGLLGDDWPAQFPVGDAPALAGLLLQTERDEAFRADLRARLAALAPAFAPAAEVGAWRALLGELGVS